MNSNILTALMAVLPKVQTGATEVIQLATEIKTLAQEAGAWTADHENILQAAVQQSGCVAAADPTAPESTAAPAVSAGTPPKPE
jgi:hypothetical protein